MQPDGHVAGCPNELICGTKPNDDRVCRRTDHVHREEPRSFNPCECAPQALVSALIATFSWMRILDGRFE